MAIFKLTPESIEAVPRTAFDTIGVKERGDLQRLIKSNINVILPDTLVISEEFSDWEGSKRSIDLLALSSEGNLIVIELKRTMTGDYMDLQALRYAAMVSEMTFRKAVEVHSDYLKKCGSADEAESAILTFLNWNEPREEEFAQDVSIVLVSADFSPELTTTVMWLIQRGIDIKCVRIQPYLSGTDVLIDVQQLIPLPEAADYQIKIREKKAEEQLGTRTSEEKRKKFWTEFLQKSKVSNKIHANISPTTADSLTGTTGLGGVEILCVLQKSRGIVMLLVQTSDKQRNKKIFDRLYEKKVEIESRYGEPLTWERQDQNTRSAVRKVIDIGGYADKNCWDALQEQMIESLNRFIIAFQPVIDSLKASGI